MTTSGGQAKPERPAGYRERQVLLDAGQLDRALKRMAGEIARRHPEMGALVVVGIRTRGVPLARRIARLLKARCGVEPPVGALDITLYRDDLTTIAAQPVMKGTEINFSIDGRTVILADDVLFTGRTVRAALDELIDFGRPARIELLVVVDRGHRELPIRADYAGRETTTGADDIVQVQFEEEDGQDRVVLLGKVKSAASSPAAPASKRGSSPRASARGRAGRK